MLDLLRAPGVATERADAVRALDVLRVHDEAARAQVVSDVPRRARAPPADAERYDLPRAARRVVGDPHAPRFDRVGRPRRGGSEVEE